MGLPGLNGHKKGRYYLKTALLKSFGFEPSLKRFYFLENFADHLRFKQCWNVGEVNNAPVISSMWKPGDNPATRNWQILQNARFLQVLIFSKYYNFPDFYIWNVFCSIFFLYCKYWIFKQNHTFKLITIQFLTNTAMKYQLTSLILWCECLLEAVSWEFPIHKENVKVKMSEIRTLFLMETLFYFKMTTKVLTNELFSWPFVTIDTRKLLHFTDFEDTGLH